MNLRTKKGDTSVIQLIPMAITMPSDTITPVSAFIRLSGHHRCSFLLESVERGESPSRYSYIGVDPVESMFVTGDELIVAGGDGQRPQTITGNPYHRLTRHFKRYERLAPTTGTPPLPPFSGGLVGYVGYESARFFERLPVARRRLHPFDLHFMLFNTVVAFDHVAQTVTLITHVMLDRESKAEGSRRATKRLQKLHAQLVKASLEEQFIAKPPSRIRLKSTLGMSRFKDGVREIKSLIRQGDIFQCVLSERFELELDENPFEIYRRLRRVSPSPFHFYISNGSEVLLGASPERLVGIRGRHIETSPIAGTRKRGATREDDVKFERQLLASEKERAEHTMLVDLSRNDVGRVAVPGSVAVDKLMQVERFSHLMHLVSTVSGTLRRGADGWTALASCFPAGTLSGAPKIRAMETIARLETTQRGPYGGAVVYQDFSGDLESCITIRSLHCVGSRASLRAGAGIVADSSPDREYEEVLGKLRALRIALEGKSI